MFFQNFQKRNFRFSEIEVNLRAIFYPQRKLGFNELGIVVLSVDETIDLMIGGKSSLSRFGDGEIAIMAGNNGVGFQDKNDDLSDRLLEVFTSDDSRVMIGLPDQLTHIHHSIRRTRKFWIDFLFKYDNFLKQHLNTSHRYANTNFSRFYMVFKSKEKASARFEKIKKIWKGKDVLIVEGEFSRLGVGNDLFRYTKSLKRILCSAKNAWNQYERILAEVRVQGEGKLILLALGPTATVLAYDLARAGFRAIDLGHLDVEYMWMLTKAQKKTSLPGRYINEAFSSNLTLEKSLVEQYQNEIISKVLP